MKNLIKTTAKALILTVALTTTVATPAMARDVHDRDHRHEEVKSSGNGLLGGIVLGVFAAATVYAVTHQDAAAPAPVDDSYAPDSVVHRLPVDNAVYYQDSAQRKPLPMNPV